MKKIWKIALGLGMAAAVPTLGVTEGYPEKPVSFVVPWGPGDVEDLLTRMIAEEFQSEYGVAAAVVNKPSGGGGPFPGAAEVAKAPADGYTVGSFVIGVPLVGPYVGIPELNPDPFDPIGIFMTYPFVIVAGKDAPYSTMEELAAYSQDNKVLLGHYGNFLIPTQVTKAHALRAGIKYSSDAAYDVLDCNSIKSGDVDVMNTTIPAILPCLDSVTILASITEERTKFAPDAPTIGEVYPDLNITLWNGLFVRKDVPQDARDKITAVAERVMAGEAAQKLAADTGTGVYWQDAETSVARILKDAETSSGVTAALEE
jgi:tripartite-type tricarboxylate transporter receptor subunit TctC